MKMNLGFVGLGKLGLPLACCLAKHNKIYAVDKNEYVLDVLNKGKLPFFEPGLEELYNEVKINFQNFASSIKETIRQTEATIILVNTQLGDNGYSDVLVENVIEDISIHLKEIDQYHTIILSSTVMPGSIKRLIKTVEKISGKTYGKNFGFVYVPDFVRLGNVIYDFKNPEYFLVGCNYEYDFEVVSSIWKGMHENNCPHYTLTLEETEIAKITSNAYLVNKISFANHLGMLCDGLENVNVHNITKVIGIDKRISPYFFGFGTPYGGTCFPRDTTAFIKFSEQQKNEAGNLIFAEKVNKNLQEWIFSKVMNYQRVGVLGYSFKPDTPVVVSSPSVKLVNNLIASGICTNVFDYLESSLVEIDNKANTFNNVQECIDNSDIVVIMHPDKRFKDFTFKNVLDIWGILK